MSGAKETIARALSGGTARIRLCLLMMGCLIGLVAVYVLFGYKNDNWWMLATGQYILENGIPYENPFTPDGMDVAIVVQQWIYCALFRLSFDVCGWSGVALLHALMALVLVWAMWWLACTVTDVFESRAIAFSAGIFFALAACIWHPRGLTVALSVIVLCLLERYRKSHDIKILIVLPLLVLFHVNWQASLAPFDLFLIFVYALPDLSWRKEEKPESEAYPRKPIWIVLVLSTAAMLVNPYGIDGATYLIDSVMPASYGEAIAELRPLTAGTGVFARIAIALLVDFFFGLIICNFVKKNVRSRTWILFLATGIALMMALRNRMLFAPVAILVSALLIDWIAENKKALSVITWIITCLFVSYTVWLVYPKPARAEGAWTRSPSIWAFSDVGSENESLEAPVEAVAIMEESGAVPGDAVLVFCEHGGYLEYRGYKVTEDGRPELWSSKIAKQPGFERHIYYVAGELYSDEMPELLDMMQVKLVDTVDVEWAILNTRDRVMTEVLTRSGEWEQIGQTPTNSVWHKVS